MDAVLRAPRGAALPYADDLRWMYAAAGHPTGATAPKTTACRKSGTDMYSFYEYVVWQRSIGEFMEQLAKLKLDNAARHDAACQH